MSKLHIPALMAVILVTSPALAQTEAAKDNSAVKTAHTVNDGSAREGANSFTESQARDHIAKSGYSQVSPLKKDAKGVWHGTAVKDGRTVAIGLDFKGNVVAAE